MAGAISPVIIYHWASHVTNSCGRHTGPHRHRALPSLKKILLDSAGLGHSFIGSFSSYLTEYLLCGRPCSRFWEVNGQTRKASLGTFMMVQWLRLWTFYAGGPGLIPGQGTTIPRAMWHGRKKKKEKQISSLTEWLPWWVRQSTEKSLQNTKRAPRKPARVRKCRAMVSGGHRYGWGKQAQGECWPVSLSSWLPHCLVQMCLLRFREMNRCVPGMVTSPLCGLVYHLLRGWWRQSVRSFPCGEESVVTWWVWSLF